MTKERTKKTVGSLCRAAVDDQIAMNDDAGPAVMIKPPFEGRAKAATPRSISGASRTLIGLTSTPSDGAAELIAPHWPVPEPMRSIPKNCHPRHPWRDLLEQPQPLRAETVIEQHKAGGVAARPRQTID